MIEYFKSRTTITDMYKQSQSFLVKLKFRKQVKTYLKEDFINSLQCGTDLYRDIPKSMKSMKSKEFEKKYGS